MILIIYLLSNTDSLVLKSANDTYHLPFVIKSIKTKPRIIGISPRFVTDIEPKGIVPLISYATSISFADTVALKAENKAMQLVVPVIFKGAGKNKPCIVYQAFNQIPNAITDVKCYKFIQRLRYGKSE